MGVWVGFGTGMLGAAGEWNTASEREPGDPTEAALIESMDEVAEVACCFLSKVKGVVEDEDGPRGRGEVNGVK